MLKSAERAQQKIAAERERVYAKAKAEVEAEWERRLAVAEQEAAENRAWIEVQRERRAAAQAMVEARETAESEEDEMATTGTAMIEKMVNGKATPFSKEAQIHGRKKPGAAARIKAESKAMADRKAVKRGIAPSAKDPKSPTIAERTAATNAKAAIKTVASTDAKLLPNNAAAAKKDGVILVESSKVPGTYFVWVAGTRDRAISGRLASKSVAEAAVKKLGLHVAK